MTIDDGDRLYVATGAGIEVMSPRGQHVGTIPVRCPPRDCQNLAFGGPEKKTLYRRFRFSLQGRYDRSGIQRTLEVVRRNSQIPADRNQSSTGALKRSDLNF